MKKVILLFLSVLTLTAVAQVTTVPSIIQKGYTGEVTIIFNPNEGNGGMAKATQCYAHTGVTYNGNSWQKANAKWRPNSRSAVRMKLPACPMFPCRESCIKNTLPPVHTVWKALCSAGTSVIIPA